MKKMELFTITGFVALITAFFIIHPLAAAAFNPQPEPPGKQRGEKINPGETKSGIVIEERTKGSLKQKGSTKSGAAQSGIAIEEKQGRSAK